MWQRVMVLVFGVLILGVVWADEKIVLSEDAPRKAGALEVLADGGRVFVGADDSAYDVYDAQGKRLDRYRPAFRAVVRDFCPITRGELTGWYVGIETYFSARIALHRPDGSEAKVLLSPNGRETGIHGDGGGDASPIGGGTIDDVREIIFALDQSRNTARAVNWSRIAMFDFTGKYLGDLRRFDLNSKKPEETDPDRQTYYYDIEADPARQLLFVTTNKPKDNELLVLRYDKEHLGELVGRVPGRCGVAILPDQRVATFTQDLRGIQLYSANLKPERVIPLDPTVKFYRAYELSRLDLEADARGRLYATGGDMDITFARWSPDFARVEYIGPNFQKLTVNWPEGMLTAGRAMRISASLTGCPLPEHPDQWQVLLRPSDGSQLRWQPVALAGHPLHLRRRGIARHGAEGSAGHL